MSDAVAIPPKSVERVQRRHSAGLVTSSVAALGIVFGDIGTSPLYTLKTVLDTSGERPDAAAAMGVLSLLVWTLIIVTSLKYVAVAMRIDNDGEGGILALMALLGLRRAHRHWIVVAGLLGAALIYGDGAITPAISVLSALEGTDLIAPWLAPYVLPTTVVILLALFAIQPLGTARIGAAFGPVMALWFLAIAILGLYGIFKHPAVLWALNPLYAAHYIVNGGAAGFLVLGSVFLCVTGAEALYADMGHFGARPIRLAWYALVFPSLVLNYAGQAALVASGAPIDGNIFFRLCPPELLVPIVLLATVATIIASQSIITGAFSMTRQAIQLGWMPRFKILQTSASGYGQIYVGPVNWALMVVTLGLALFFRKSDNLAGAYGIAVSATMLMTTVLLFIAMREILNWGVALSAAIAAGFFIVDGAFFVANLAKLLDGGYVPLVLAAMVYFIMFTWHRGAAAVAARMAETVVPIDAFMETIETGRVPRVPGTAVFLTRTRAGAPPVMVWHLKHNRALHEYLFVLTVTTEQVPWVTDGARVTVEKVAPNFWRARARYGFMERPDVPHLLAQAHEHGCTIDLSDVTYYVGHETVVHRINGPGLPVWQEALFSFMERNATHVSDYFFLPSDRTVEIGRRIAI